ncbi:hypothetical protein AAC387_Pa04g2797 [Persea americana]
MKRKKEHVFFFHLNHLLFLVVVFMVVGSCQGSRLNQAGKLQALLKVKKQHGAREEWATPTWVEDGPSEVGAMELDLITNGLPGQPSSVKFKQYSGYITVDELNQRRLFYYFAESVPDPSTKPLLLWLNGGPGCSSLGFGAMLEIGPFGVKPDGKTLYHRLNSWNKAANTLFIESPAGVGFSYSNTTSDYDSSGDKRTAKDSYTFLVNWFKRFPHYKNRDFYIAGESYAGFYIPELADIVIQQNMQQHDFSGYIQLKGVMIGNGIMNDVTDQKGMYDYIWTHALISDETHKGLMKHCAYGGSDEKDKPISKFKCSEFEDEIGKEAGDIDFYNIYAPICPEDSSNASTKTNKPNKGLDPCDEDYIYAYLNLPQVQEALHANITGLPYPWNFCSEVISSWVDYPTTMFPVYKRLIPNGLRILLYSGDMDAVVPVTSTRYSIDALNLMVKEPWKPWIDNNGEVGGYRVVYDGLTLATIRGAGHEVPKYQSGRAFTLLNYFLNSK